MRALSNIARRLWFDKSREARLIRFIIAWSKAYLVDGGHFIAPQDLACIKFSTLSVEVEWRRGQQKILRREQTLINQPKLNEPIQIIRTLKTLEQLYPYAGVQKNG